MENNTIRAPSPRKHSALVTVTDDFDTPSQAPTPTPQTTLTTHPHLAHYIHSLLNNVHFPPPRSALSQHPLSVYSSGGSNDSDSDDEHHGNVSNVSQSGSEAASTSGASGVTKSSQEGGLAKSDDGSSRKATTAEKEELVKKIVELLDNDQEEEIKGTLKPYMGELGKDDLLMDQVCLDCMHKRRDDIEGLPYAPHLTPTRARASPAVGARPYTPTRVPSFRSRTPLSRTHSPVPPIPSHSSAIVPPKPASSSGYSPAPSPLASPRMLNAKASTFNPSARVVSGSPFGAIGAPSMARTGSNLAIASPLFSDQQSPFHSPVGTPQRTPVKMPDLFSSPAQRAAASKGIMPDDDDDDEFSPFGKGLPKLHHHDTSLKADSKPFNPYFFGAPLGPALDVNAGEYTPNIAMSDTSTSYSSSNIGPSDVLDESTTETGSGMTPLDVLCSVFTSVPRPELEDALHRSGYDFEAAMSMLVAAYTNPRSGASTPQRVSSPRPHIGMGRGGRDGYFPTVNSRTLRRDISPMGGTRSPAGANGGKMCRYFLAGECRRSDCRFSHDLDRAMCRFWLRGHCAKGPNCEFLHSFPNNLDVSALQTAMSRVELSQDDYARPDSLGNWHQPPEEFPDLATARSARAPRFDPSRNRFANAIKRAAPAPPRDFPSAQAQAAHSQDYLSDSSTSSVPALPRPSMRIKLRPPTLLPTLKTGTAANDQYLASRSTSIRLGHARNACLARAADAFRRGDGAAAKRFSREGKALNQRMLNEAAEAAQGLVKERQAEAMEAVKERPAGWSDDPADRSQRGKTCAGGLGVILGVASTSRLPPNANASSLSSEERTEALLDLHTLHGNEAVDILGQFLAELERERFRGLAYVVVGEERHVGTQDEKRGAGKVRLGTSVKNALAGWGYAWNESAGIICVDPCRT
ncbi:hypothetical protein I314_03225 [Cryptococcus bacillisporus CA1873]|uniref:C3H1-type domain-containing protein n=1 Tax=Cryptococcus bacillisporus CA1873 TaxID=1296111 RepID=A0ABR5BBY3_CRYGA|nr:hypothetical protein I314_03225 [Cryptococcus bacillisporus CA1873]|eukprot:KIR63819.1 hypothetical protein I314_03225 [Cryptococcus gattii CA1873]